MNDKLANGHMGGGSCSYFHFRFKKKVHIQLNLQEKRKKICVGKCVVYIFFGSTTGIQAR